MKKRYSKEERKMFVDDFNGQTKLGAKEYAEKMAIPNSTFYYWLNAKSIKAKKRYKKKKIGRVAVDGVGLQVKASYENKPSSLEKRVAVLEAMLKEKIFEIELLKNGLS